MPPNDVMSIAVALAMSIVAALGAWAFQQLKRAWGLRKLREALKPELRCPKCDAEIRPDYLRCPKCGHELGEAERLAAKAKATAREADERVKRTPVKVREFADPLIEWLLPENDPDVGSLLTRAVGSGLSAAGEEGLKKAMEPLGLPDPKDVMLYVFCRLLKAYAGLALRGYWASEENKRLKDELEELRPLRPLRRWLKTLNRLEKLEEGEEYDEW